MTPAAKIFRRTLLAAGAIAFVIEAGRVASLPPELSFPPAPVLSPKMKSLQPQFSGVQAWPPSGAQFIPNTSRLTKSGDVLTFSFLTTNGVNYQPRFSPALPHPAWQNFGSPVAGDGGYQSVNYPWSNGLAGFFQALPLPVADQFLWARSGVVNPSATCRRIAADTAGNLVAVGWFGPTVDFGNGPMTSAGGNDCFVVKYSSTGALLWTKRFGSTGDDYAFAVGTDSSDNIFVTGYFVGMVDFGGTTLTNASASSADVFVVKYSPTGSLTWVKQFGGTQADFGRALAVDSSGNVLISGVYSSSSISFGTNTLTSGSIYTAKLNGANGAVAWAKQWGTPGTIQVNHVAADSAGNLLLTGSQYNPALFLNNALVAKYSGADGSQIWSKTFPSTSSAAQAGGWVSAASGNGVLVTGTFGGVTDFGGPIVDWFGATNNGATNGGIFIAAYDASGSYQWAKTPNASAEGYGFSDEAGNAIVADADGNIYCGGNCNSALYFATGGLLLGGKDNWSAKLTSTGTTIWAKRGQGGKILSAAVGAKVQFGGETLGPIGTFDRSQGATGGTVTNQGGFTAPWVAQFNR